MEKSEELIRLEQEKENNSTALSDLYLKRNMLEDELSGIKDTIQRYKDIIKEIEKTQSKLTKYLTKGVIISLLPLITAILVSIGPIITFFSVKEVVQMVLGCSLMTALFLTPPSILIGFKDYRNAKKILNKNSIEYLKLLLEREEETKNIIIEENNENNRVIDFNEKKKQNIESCINKILNNNSVIETDEKEELNKLEKVKKIGGKNGKRIITKKER